MTNRRQSGNEVPVAPSPSRTDDLKAFEVLDRHVPPGERHDAARDYSRRACDGFANDVARIGSYEPKSVAAAAATR